MPTFISSDFRSIEPCVNAFLAKCKSWMEMFWYAKDHPDDPAGDVYNVTYASVSTALKWAKLLPSEVTKDQRTLAKVINLGGQYDFAPAGLAALLDCSKEEAREILNAFLKVTVPEILHRSSQIRKAVLRGEERFTIFGRRRTYPLDLPYPERYEREIEFSDGLPLYELCEAIPITGADAGRLREATNNETQSPANDINLLCKRYISDHLYEYPRLFPCMTIHDSIMFVSFSEGRALYEEMEFIEHCSTNPHLYLPQKILQTLGWEEKSPLRVEIVYGPNKADLKPFKS